MCDYIIVSKNHLDKLFKTDMWYRYDLWGTNELLFQLVQTDVKLSDICRKVFNISNSEWRRKLKEGAVDFGKSGFTRTVDRDEVIDKEGYYEVKYGKHTHLAIIVPEPWYIALWLRFTYLWNRTFLKKLYLM